MPNEPKRDNLAQWFRMGIESWLEDSELAKGVARGQEEKLLAFFRAYHAGVYRYLLCLVLTTEDAEDLAQEAMIQARSRIKTYRGESSLKTWVHRVAYRTFTHWSRRRRVEDRLDEHLAASARFEREADDRQVLLDALKSLAPVLAHTFVLSEISGLGVAEIAQVMEIPEGTVKSRLFTARQRLRELLADETMEKPYARPR